MDSESQPSTTWAEIIFHTLSATPLTPSWLPYARQQDTILPIVP
jgi:hypothetical protein